MIAESYWQLRERVEQVKGKPKRFQIRVGSATCEHASGAREVLQVLREAVSAAELQEVELLEVGCTGRCSCEPIVSVSEIGKKTVIYQGVDRVLAERIIKEHLQMGQLVKEALLGAPELYLGEFSPKFSDKQALLAQFPVTQDFLRLYGNVPFYDKQVRVALRNVGIVCPESFEDYLQHHGFSGLAKALECGPDWVIQEVIEAKLRGRGGGGFLTGRKWQLARENEEKVRYVICNADEGDPGAFMDRGLLESDPFGVLEGMLIAGYAIGATQGFLYIRAEYPLAVERVRKGIVACRRWGLLGKNILNSGFDFDLEVRLGAGAFVCGEETALIHSIEGQRGQPRLRPPYPATQGLWGKPTVINNVETLSNVTAILGIGGSNFHKIGTERSGGTKVFALAGKVRDTGLIEVPIGISLREVIYEFGGGLVGDKQLKAIQTGGPSGGLIPATLIDTVVDYEDLAAVDSIMGSGGMIVLDEDDCAVDVAKFFVAFTQDESCGKCVPCREGTLRMLELLEKITRGQGTLKDLEHLERLSYLVSRSSLCGLGKAAPNPVLSTLRYFREEYLSHVVDKRCLAKKCTALVQYYIDDQRCVGCTVCKRQCPVQAISGERKEVHIIDQNRCVKCGVCVDACPFKAIYKQ